MNKNLTLEDFKSIDRTKLFMAVIVEPLSKQAGEKILSDVSNTTKIDDLDTFDNIKTKIQNATNATSQELDSILNEFIYPFLEQNTVTCIYKDDEFCINLGIYGEQYPKITDIHYMEPLSNYYKEGEYKFIEKKGRIYINVDDIKPYEEYSNKVNKAKAEKT